MQLTVEQRHLLEGDEKRDARKAPRLGFADATSAPDWAQTRILQIRSAIVEKRSIPAPSRAFIAGCEQRSLAQRQAAPVVKPIVDVELEALKQRAFKLGQVILADQRRMREESASIRKDVLAMADEIRIAAAAAGAL
jgi:hypothetical protein